MPPDSLAAQRLWPLLLLSLLIHVALLLLLSLYVAPFPPPPPQLIQAQLVFPQPAALPRQTPPSQAGSAPPAVQPRVADTGPVATERDAPPATSLAQVPIEQQQHAPTHAPASSPEASNKRAGDILRLSKDYLHARTAVDINRHLKDAKRQQLTEYTRASKAPVYVHEQQLRRAIRVEVDCRKALSKALTMLAGLTGGSIGCQQYQGAQQQIDKRLKRFRGTQNDTEIKLRK